MYKFARIFTGLVFVFLLASATFSATFTVTKTADTNDGTCDADCSLREAVTAANTAAGDDIVNFDAAVFGTAQTITLTLGEIVITANGSFTLNGTGASRLTIDGNMASRILTINNAVAFIKDLTFTHGNGAGTANTGRGGAIYNFGATTIISNSVITANSAANGGGLNNSATTSTPGPAQVGNLTFDNCIVSNNTATGSGGGMQNFSTSTVTITNSIFMGNSSGGTTGGGGGQFNGGVRITNSTFANNTAPNGGGGGIQSNGTLGTLLTNVTISNNTSTTNGGGIHRGTTNTNFFIRNSIVAGNNGDPISPDITNSTGGIVSEGNNIIGNVGTSTGWIMSDLLNTNPLLNPLANNGGFTMTFLPMAGSPAIDAGQNCVLDLTCATNNPPQAVTTDQRGVMRPQGAAVDIGSVEVAATMTSNATVSGRVLLASGQGVSKAIVTISDTNGVIQTALTSSFGYFTFAGISTGQAYTLNVSSKQYSFSPQQVTVNGDITNLTITATGENLNSGELKSIFSKMEIF
ncbi:MAG: choice-of-anchor Q domain-containing protein [Pyrinomonadaceae bacterium]